MLRHGTNVCLDVLNAHFQECRDGGVEARDAEEVKRTVFVPAGCILKVEAIPEEIFEVVLDARPSDVRGLESRLQLLSEINEGYSLRCHQPLLASARKEVDLHLVDVDRGDTGGLDCIHTEDNVL